MADCGAASECDFSIGSNDELAELPAILISVWPGAAPTAARDAHKIGMYIWQGLKGNDLATIALAAALLHILADICSDIEQQVDAVMGQHGRRIVPARHFQAQHPEAALHQFLQEFHRPLR